MGRNVLIVANNGPGSYHLEDINRSYHQGDINEKRLPPPMESRTLKKVFHLDDFM